MDKLCAVQAVSQKLFVLLDTMLSFCSAASMALCYCEPKARQRSGVAYSQMSSKTAAAAAHKAMALAQQFGDAVPDLVALLESHISSHVASVQHQWLLEALTFNSYYRRSMSAG